MEASVQIAVLRELGVLFEAPGAAHADPEPPLPEADHAWHEHLPLWDYEAPGFDRPFADPDIRPLYQTLPPGTGVEQALAATRLLVFLGAGDTPALRRALAEPDALLLVFDHDPARVARMAKAIGPTRLAGRMHVFLGRVDEFLPPLGMVLPATLFRAGFPAFFALPPLAAARPELAEKAVLLLETLFFRNVVYPLSGQANNRGLPLRQITRGLFYDQQLHACQNVRDMALAPDIGVLRRAFQGETAILVAAGPELPERLGYIARQREKGVVIAVNNALKPLLAAGVRPHFVVANDTSIHTADSWSGLERLPDVALVGHCLADLGVAVFPTRFLFGSYRPEVYGPKPSLRLHGSVITTAFSLARHLGCARCVLVGVQLCSDNPWTLRYSKGTVHGDAGAGHDPEKPLRGGYPQLIPVTNRFGLTRYTTLNFLDACLWFLDEIRATGLPCVNVTMESLVHGPGVEYDPDCEVAATGNLERRLRQVGALRARPRPLEPVRKAVAAELRSWRSVAQSCRSLAQGSGPGFVAAALEAVRQFDQGNVSYLVQRYQDFNNRLFQSIVFGPERHRLEWGLKYYLDYVGRMAEEFAGVLEEQLGLLA